MSDFQDPCACDACSKFPLDELEILAYAVDTRSDDRLQVLPNPSGLLVLRIAIVRPSAR